LRKSLGGWIRRRRRRDSYTDLWRYERMEGASHWIPLDQPERLNKFLLEFLPTRSA
jgi:pimeloyl-ACP methyl ester carboxylesterase